MALLKELEPEVRTVLGMIDRGVATQIPCVLLGMGVVVWVVSWFP
jgi:hypothetical protein